MYLNYCETEKCYPLSIVSQKFLPNYNIFSKKIEFLKIKTIKTKTLLYLQIITIISYLYTNKYLF